MAQHRQHDQPRSPARRGRKRGAAAQGIGRSRGGLSTKVHVVVDALGLPLTFEVTEGQRHDNRPAKELVARVLSTCLLADKAYDSDAFRAGLAEQNCVPVIPSNGSRAQKLPYDEIRTTKRAPRSSARSPCSSRPGASQLGTRRRCATTRPSSPSDARSCGSESSRHISAQVTCSASPRSSSRA